MKYIKNYKIFEASSQYWKDESNKLIDGIIKDIQNIFKKYNTEYIAFPNDHSCPKIKRNVTKYDNSRYAPNVIGMEKKDVYLYSLYSHKNDVYCSYIYEQDEEEDLRKMPFFEVIEIYNYLENMDIMDLLNTLYDNDNHYELSKFIYNNIDDIDFDNIGNKDIFELYEDQPDEYEKIVETEEFQKWLCETYPTKINWLIENNIEINENIKKEYEDLFDSNELGLI